MFQKHGFLFGNYEHGILFGLTSEPTPINKSSCEASRHLAAENKQLSKVRHAKITHWFCLMTASLYIMVYLESPIELCVVCASSFRDTMKLGCLGNSNMFFVWFFRFIFLSFSRDPITERLMMIGVYTSPPHQGI